MIGGTECHPQTLDPSGRDLPSVFVWRFGGAGKIAIQFYRRFWAA
jgi:hypothetical protein